MPSPGFLSFYKNEEAKFILPDVEALQIFGLLKAIQGWNVGEEKVLESNNCVVLRKVIYSHAPFCQMEHIFHLEDGTPVRNR